MLSYPHFEIRTIQSLLCHNPTENGLVLYFSTIYSEANGLGIRKPHYQMCRLSNAPSKACPPTSTFFMLILDKSLATSRGGSWVSPLIKEKLSQEFSCLFSSNPLCPSTSFSFLVWSSITDFFPSVNSGNCRTHTGNFENLDQIRSIYLSQCCLNSLKISNSLLFYGFLVYL